MPKKKRERPPAHGDLLYRKRLYEKIVGGNPRYLDALICLGNTYTRLGDFAGALRVDLRIADILPGEPTVYYNLACDYSLLDNIEDALKNLRIALLCGYRDFRHLRQDEDLANIRKDGRFARLVENRDLFHEKH